MENWLFFRKEKNVKYKYYETDNKLIIGVIRGGESVPVQPSTTFQLLCMSYLNLTGLWRKNQAITSRNVMEYTYGATGSFGYCDPIRSSPLGKPQTAAIESAQHLWFLLPKKKNNNPR